MAVIPTYNDSVLPQGQMSSQATAEDFGSQIGTALHGVGDTLQNVGSLLHKANQDNERIKAYKDTSDAYINLKNNFNTSVNSLNPNDPEFTNKLDTVSSDFRSKIDETTADLQSRATSKSASLLIASHMAENGKSLLNYAASEQARIMGDYTSKQIGDGLKIDQDALSADPTNDNYNRIINNRKEMIQGLNNINPVMKINWLDKIEHDMALTQVQVLASTNPNEFLRSVNAQGGSISRKGFNKKEVPGGVEFTDNINNPDYPQVQPLTDQDVAEAKSPIQGWNKLSWAEKLASVRQAESTVGAGLSQSRGEITRAIGDINSTLRSGIAYPNINDPKFSRDNLIKTFGADEGQRAFDSIEYSKSVGSFISQMSTAPLDQAKAMLKNLEPQGGYEFATKSSVYNQATDALARLQDIRNKDYMAWALNTPNTNVKPIDFSTASTFKESLTARIAPAITGVQDYKADAHLMSRNESEAFSSAITDKPPQEQIAFLKAVRQATVGHDNWFMDALNQLSSRNTMLGFASAVANRDGVVDTGKGIQSGSMVGQYILEGTHILQGKDLNDPTKSGKPLSISDEMLRTKFWEVVGGNAFNSPNAQRSSQMANDTFQAVKNYIVADRYHNGNLGGKSITSEEVNRAVKAVTGGVSNVGSNGEKLFMPWGMTEEKFQQEFPKQVSKTIEENGLKGTALDSPSSFHYSNIGDGKYLINTSSGKPLVNPSSHKAVIVDFNKNKDSK